MALRVKTVRYCLTDPTIDSVSPQVGKCWTDNGAGGWVNETADINNTTASDVPLATAVGSAIYFGHARKFTSLTFDTGTTPSGGAATWEYWDGSAWTAISGVTGGTAPSDNSTVYFDPPSNWATTQVNSEVDGPWYYIRLRVTTLRTTAGAFNAVHLGPLLNLASTRTIHIPETSSRTILHATLRVHMVNQTTQTIDHIACRGRWGAASEADIVARMTTANQIAHGESSSGEFDLDWDTATATAWASGTSQTVDAWIAWNGRGAAITDANTRFAAWAELLITYQFDDAASTQLNSIVLPFDGITGDIGTTLANVGAAGQWPILTGGSGVIKEASPTIRDAYVVLVANVNEAGTTDYTIGASLDAEGETILLQCDAANQSDYLIRIPWRRTDASTTAAHDVKCRVSSATGATLAHVGGYLVVTYEYDESTTTTYTHTDVLPVQVQTGYGNGTTSADQSKITIPHWIAGASPTLIQAGCLLYSYQAADPGSLLVAWGAQTPRTYTVPAADTTGPVPICQRFDSGAVAGSGGTLARGRNEWTISAYYTGTPASGGGIGGEVFVTYSYTKESGKRHSTAMFPSCRPSSLALATRQSDNFQLDIPETNWFIASCGMHVTDWTSNAETTSRMKLRKASGEGWFVEPGSLTGMDGNRGIRIHCCALEDASVRYTGDPRTDRLNPVAAALPALCDGPSGVTSGCVWANWHDYTWAVAGNVTGSSGGTVNIALHDSASGDLLKTTSRVGNGSYSITWHDNTRNVYTVAKESGSLLARSDDGVAA